MPYKSATQMQDYQKEYRRLHKEEAIAYQKEYRKLEGMKEKVNAYSRDFYSKHRKEQLKRAIKYYYAHLEKSKERAKKYYHNNLEYERKRSREYYWKSKG